MRRLAIAAALVAAAFAGAATFAFAIDGGSGGLTSVCVGKWTGLLRADSTCTKHETRLPIGGGATRIVQRTVALTAADNGKPFTIDCAAGEHVTGGGATSTDEWGVNGLVASYPSGASSWAGYATGSLEGGSITIYAVCST